MVVIVEDFECPYLKRQQAGDECFYLCSLHEALCGKEITGSCSDWDNWREDERDESDG